jgi:hypothetical protein
VTAPWWLRQMARRAGQGRDARVRTIPRDLDVGPGGWRYRSGWLGGTSRAGFRSKKPNGLSQNETMSLGITGQSSGRVMWWVPNTTRARRRCSRSYHEPTNAALSAWPAAGPSTSGAGSCPSTPPRSVSWTVCSVMQTSRSQPVIPTTFAGLEHEEEMIGPRGRDY